MGLVYIRPETMNHFFLSPSPYVWTSPGSKDKNHMPGSWENKYHVPCGRNRLYLVNAVVLQSKEGKGKFLA